MSALVLLMDKENLVKISQSVVEGRILSVNIGKNLCTGVLRIDSKYCMFRYPIDLYDEQKIHRGDIISFNASVYEHDEKNGLNICRINKVIHCKGVLPNKQFKGVSENNRLVQCMFDPEKYAIIKSYSNVIKELRIKLYSYGFDEVNTPTLFQLQSPSNADSFSVQTVNGNTLYLKSIHEHLLKPFLIMGFDRVFEIGSVFRNIGYSHEYDCEFTNLDIWMKECTLKQLIDMCVEMTSLAANVVCCDDFSCDIVSFEDYVEKNHIKDADDKSVKQHIKANGNGKIIIVKEPKRLKNYHIMETPDQSHNEEFHAYVNGVSYAHGYIVKTDSITFDKSVSSSKCQIFEEYASYGIEEFGGVGIGIQKLLQGLLNIDDYHLLNLYRRKY